MTKYLKFRKHTFKKNQQVFLVPDGQATVFDKGLVLPDKLVCLPKTRVSNARGYANAQPRGPQ